MDSQNTSHDTSNASASMFHNATIDKAEKSEFSNTARDMFKFVLNYNAHTHSAMLPETGNTPLEFHDAMNYLLNAVPHFVEEVRKNDQLGSTSVTETGSTYDSDPVPRAITADKTPYSSENPVDVIDIMPPEPFLLPVANIADKYTRSMLKCLVGYPLYNPKPFSELSEEYPRNGVNIGDVGFVRGNGTFDFLFNICLSHSGSVNPPNLPDGFTLETLDHSVTTGLEPLPKKTCLFQSPVLKMKSGEYVCEGSEGAILELPEGATQQEATNIRPFEQLATQNGVQWYEYTMNRGRKISNGSLYLITSVTKCTHWGTAVFDRPCGPGQGLRFEKKRSLPFGKSAYKYHWRGPHVFHTKVSDTSESNGPNQCVFIRGYKIMIQQDIFDNICNDPRPPHISGLATVSSSSQPARINMTRQQATRIRGGAGPDPFSRSAVSGLVNGMETSEEEVLLHPNFSSSLVHPSDLINIALLSKHPGAKVAITHDNTWCDLLQNNFPKLDHATLINIARVYTIKIDEYDCICLERISASIDGFDRSPCPVQEIEIVQRPLTIAESGFSLSPVIPRTLPRELVERILLLLDTASILACRLVDKTFNGVIQSSTVLQYYLSCQAAGVVDNSRSPLSYAERFEALKRWEDAWRSLKPVFETMIKVNTSNQLDQTSLSYELAAGNYFLSDQDRKDLYYCHLPSSPHDNPKWIRIPGDGPQQSWSGIIGDIATAIYEHDLMANVIFSEVGNQTEVQRHTLDLILLKPSTGEYHPLARHPRIHIWRSDSDLPFINARIVGDNVALIVAGDAGSFRDKLFIFDWKTGHKRLEHETTEGAYSDLIFISPEFLLVPNCALCHFEVWYLPCSDTNLDPPTQILSLQIPAISDGCSITGMWCHGEPSLFGLSMPNLLQRPFFPAAEDSIIIVNLRFESFPEINHSAYTLIMHRRKLLNMIQKWTSPPFREKQEDPQIWLTNEVIMDEVTDPDDGSTKLTAFSKIVLTHDAPTSATFEDRPAIHASYVSTNTGSSSIPSGLPTTSSTTRCNILEVHWENWGAPISRWFEEDGDQAWRINRSIGQRYAFITPNTRDKKISVANFNPYNVRKNERVRAPPRRLNDEDVNDNEAKCEDEFELLGHDGEFAGDVYMGLKCVISDVPGKYDFDAIFMDEERLLGLKVDSDNRVDTIRVLYIG